MSTLYAAKVNASQPPKEKKPRTEKQIAAFEKAKATRARKQEEKRLQEEQEVAAKQAELEEANRKLEELEEKKRVASEKRRANREAKRKAEEAASVASVAATPEPVKKKQKVKQDEETKSETTLVATEEVKKPDETLPPAWFKKYIEGMAQTQNQLEGTKKAQKVIREEAKTVADEKWAQPNVRQQVTKTMDSHMEKMYAQIFGGRRLKV